MVKNLKFNLIFNDLLTHLAGIMKSKLPIPMRTLCMAILICKTFMPIQTPDLHRVKFITSGKAELGGQWGDYTPPDLGRIEGTAGQSDQGPNSRTIL